MQIVTHGLGAGEVYSGLAGAPTWADKINNVTNVSPCLVPTYLTKDNGKHRMLTAKQEPSDAPRELQDIMDEERPSRELWHRSSYSSYWYRVERYCKYYPNSCYHYCDWYPSWCNEFCKRFPQFCEPQTPAEIEAYYDLLDVYIACGVESLYGPNWADQVDDVCKRVSWYTCKSLKYTVNAGLAEMSRT